MTTKNDLSDLFYLDESALSTTDEDELLNLYECETAPEEIVDEVFRAKYVAFCKKQEESNDQNSD